MRLLSFESCLEFSKWVQSSICEEVSVMKTARYVSACCVSYNIFEWMILGTKEETPKYLLDLSHNSCQHT